MCLVAFTPIPTDLTLPLRFTVKLLRILWCPCAFCFAYPQQITKTQIWTTRLCVFFILQLLPVR